jgi:2-polyprenyl-3-methyl-5-hydroxy-6-metoxy-1,4-benzoquinol methylase
MKSSKIIGKISKMLSLFLKNFSLKMNAFSFKKLSDHMFAVAEKFVIKLKKFLPLYVKYYDDMINKEITATKISKSDKVIHMGCGPVPSTSILIAEKTGATVTAIDRNSRSVEEASSCIHLLNLNGRVQIKHADALNFPIEKFDIIIISHGIEPRDEILGYVSRSINDNARVIFRTFSSGDGEITQHDILLKNLFKIDKTVSHENHGLLISVILFKK